MARETINESNARIIAGLTRTDFPDYNFSTDAGPRAYASYLAERGYELGFIEGEFCAWPASPSCPGDPFDMGRALEAAWEADQFASLEDLEEDVHRFFKTPEELAGYVAPDMAVAETATAENCRHMLGGRATDENARTLCRWLAGRLYHLHIDEEDGRMVATVRPDGELCRKGVERAVRLALGGPDA